MKSAIIFWIFMVFASIAAQNITQDKPAIGISFENYSYPYAVNYIALTVQNQPVKMAYMDLKPAKSNGKTVLLLHGKNFFGAYWQETIEYLTGNGFRVIVPDQIGFGKSSKPSIFYSFHLLAENTRTLLDTLGIKQVAVVGHSMGGMLASRFVLMYPERVTHLVLENPIGLEDYKLKVPYTSVEKQYQNELKKTEEQIREYHKTYYVRWKDEYEEYVQAQYRATLNEEYAKLAWVNALTTEMIYTQPVIYEFPNIRVPTVIIIGQQNYTAFGQGALSGSGKDSVGYYVELGKKAARTIPDAILIPFENTGHIPHIETPEKFNATIVNFLVHGI